MADLGPDARLLCITSHDGELLWGKQPEPHHGYSADFLVACATYGDNAKRSKR